MRTTTCPFPRLASVRSQVRSVVRIALLALTTTTSAMAQSSSSADPNNLARYAEANARLGPPKTDEQRVVFMGNSITEAWAPHFATLFPGKPYVGRGISGQTTAQMLGRFAQDVIALSPRAVVILGGTNDIAGNGGPVPIETTQNNLAAMADSARAHGIRVVICAVLPVYDYPWRRGLEPAPKIVALNTWLRNYAASHDAVFVDLHTPLADERQGLPQRYAADGVHPNLDGYKVMSPLVETGIRATLGQR